MNVYNCIITTSISINIFPSNKPPKCKNGNFDKNKAKNGNNECLFA